MGVKEEVQRHSLSPVIWFPYQAEEEVRHLTVVPEIQMNTNEELSSTMSQSEIVLLAVTVWLAIPVLLLDVVLLHRVPALQASLITRAHTWDE